MIRGLYKTDVVTITADKYVKEAATLMRDRGVGDVVVCSTQDGSSGMSGVQPIGMITDRDIVTGCVASDADFKSVQVGDVMSKNLCCVKESAGLFETIRRMREAGVGRAVVVDDSGMLAGILTSQTIFDLLNEELNELGMIARSRRPASSERSRELDNRSETSSLRNQMRH